MEPSDPSSNQDGARTRSPALPRGGFGRGTAKHWEGKVYRPIWRDGGGQRREVNHYFVRIMVGGRREAVALNTSDRSEAGRRAARLYDRIRSLGWDVALRDFDPERHGPKSDLTVGAVVSAILKADLRDRTKGNYISALRWFAARHLRFESTRKTFGPAGSEAYRQRADGVRVTDLTTEVLQAIIAQHIAATSGDMSLQRASRISAASFLRNAKAGLNAAGKQGVRLPEPHWFEAVKKPEGATPPAYSSTFDAGELIRDAKKEMSGDAPAYIALLLALGAGLRRGEIENLCWRHVDAATLRIFVLPSGGWAPKSLESEQPVSVSEGLLEEMKPFERGPNDPVTTRPALDRCVRWLRKRGVDGAKPLHTLRKEFGSIVNAQSDIFTASRALRHSSVSVTAGVYVENRKHAAPDVGAMLAPRLKNEKTESQNNNPDDRTNPPG